MSFRELAVRCAGRWSEVMLQLTSHQEMHCAIQVGCKRHVVCPVHGGKHGDAFRIFPTFEETGGAVCNTCGTFGNGFAVLKWLHPHWSWHELALKVEAALDGNYASADRPMRTSLQTPELKPAPFSPKTNSGPPIERLRQMLKESVALEHPDAGPLRHYLVARGLYALKVRDPRIFFHRRLTYFDFATMQRVGEFPAMLAPVQSPTGELIGLHRTYLTEKGAKAPVDQPRKLLVCREGNIRGAAIRLQSAKTTLAITEAIEKGWAIAGVTGMAVWIGPSAGLLAQVIVPHFVRRVFVWADLDPPRVNGNSYKEPGYQAAVKLVARLRTEGREAQLILPPARPDGRKTDWDEALLLHGPDAFPRPHASALLLPTIGSLNGDV